MTLALVHGWKATTEVEAAFSKALLRKLRGVVTAPQPKPKKEPVEFRHVMEINGSICISFSEVRSRTGWSFRSIKNHISRERWSSMKHPQRRTHRLYKLDDVMKTFNRTNRDRRGVRNRKRK